MDNQSERVSLEKLEHLQAQFADVEIGARVIPMSEAFPMSSLLVAADEDYKGRKQMINLAYVNDLADEESSLALLQYFTELEPQFQDDQQKELEDMLNFINIRMPLGMFCCQSNKVYFRYVLADLKNDANHAMRVIATFFTYIDVLDIFQEAIEQVIEGSLSLSAFKARF